METQILSSGVNQVQEQAPACAGGLLTAGEKAGAYTVIKRLAADTGEAEIYLCSKDTQTFVLKYYYTKRPNAEIIGKLKAFKHPNIVSLIEYGDYKTRFYEILEYAGGGGGSLDEKTAGGRYKYLPVTETTAEQIVKEAVNAFDACHKAGIIHRDIKPGNLFYKYEGKDILVGDFGISSSFDVDAGMSKHLTQTGARTDGYAAPEAYSGVIGPEWDYYSLGVTLWELLTGKDPFVNEKGQALYPGQIALDTMQGKTADLLLSRSTQISGRMRQLIRGLMTVRHDKRWGYGEVSRFLAGETVEVFDEVRDLPTLEIAGEQCGSFKEIAQALIAHPDEGKNLIYKGKLLAYLIKIDQQFTEKLLDVIDDYSAKNQLNRGLIHVAYSLCPNLPFAVGNGRTIASLQELRSLLVTNPEAVMPWLRDTARGIYTYFEVIGLGDTGERVQEIVKAVDSDFKAAPRIAVALDGNEIAPFRDGVNNAVKLKTLEQLYNLPEYLKERVLLFIERKSGLVSAWIENVTGRNLDLWLYKLDHQKEKLIAWGKWKYFTLFLEKKDIQCGESFSIEKDGKKLYGYKDPFGKELLPAIWEGPARENGIVCDSITDTFAVKKNGNYGVIKADGSIIIPLKYHYLNVFNEEKGLYRVEVILDKNPRVKPSAIPLPPRPETETQIITEKGEILCKGEWLNVTSAPGNPFDVITDGPIGMSKIFSKDFKIIKEVDSLVIYQKDNVNYLWVMDKNQTYICNGDGVTINELPYSEFEDTYINDTIIFVKQGAYWGVSDAAGELLIPCIYDKKKNGSKRGILLGKKGMYDLFQFANGTTDPHLLCKIYDKSDCLEIHDLAGQFCFKALYIIGFYFEKPDDILEMPDRLSEPFDHFIDCLSCFDGTNFLSFNLKTLKTEPRYELEDGEMKQLMEHINTKQLLQMISSLKKQNKIPEMNKLVDSTTRYFYNKKDWETFRSLLLFIDENNMDGLSKSYDDYLYFIAVALEYQENYKEALGYYEEGITRNPNAYDIYLRCGDVYMKLKNYKKALQYYEKSLEFEPEKPLLLNRKGKALYSLDRKKEAIPFYTMAIEHAENEKDKAIFYDNRGNAYKDLGMRDKADADYRAAKKCKEPKSIAPSLFRRD